MVISDNNIEKQLDSFKKRFYQNLLLSGIFFTIATVLVILILLSIAEYLGQFDSTVRFAFLSFFVLVNFFLIVKYVVLPILGVIGVKREITNKDVAITIGKYYPNINDKLLNFIQLKTQYKSSEPLLEAALIQKNRDFNNYDFDKAIDYSKSKKHIIILGIILLILLVFNLSMPNLIRDGVKRIYNYQNAFDNPNNLKFELYNFKNYALVGSDVFLQLKVNGDVITNEVVLIIGAKELNLVNKNNESKFEYIIKNIQKDTQFQFRVGKTYSPIYEVSLVNNPIIKEMVYTIAYPRYLNRKGEQIINNGNLSLPEGSKIELQIYTDDNTSVSLEIEKKRTNLIKADQYFGYKKEIRENFDYTIYLNNEKHNAIQEKINYQINCIKDAYPTIEVAKSTDSITFSNISFAGKIADDNGLSKLSICYQVLNSSGINIKSGKKLIPIDNQSKEQRFIYTWVLDSGLLNNDRLVYYLEVSDNDGINGSKTTQSVRFEQILPTKQTISKNFEQQNKLQESELKAIKSDRRANKQKISDIEDKIKSKQNLSWQDKKEISNLIKENKQNSEKIEDLKKKFDALNEQKQQIENERSAELEEKIKMLSELMNQVIDEETKKMYERLEQILNEQGSKNEIDKLIKNLAKKEDLFNNEISKMLEMFKQIQFEEKLEKNINDLNKLSEEQLQLSEKELSKNQNENQKLAEEQNQINQKFDDIKKDIDNLNKMNNELEEKNDLNVDKNKLEEISGHQNKAEQQLKSGNKGAKENQKNSGDKMKALANKMEEANNANQLEQKEENIKDLRSILENLVHLSFEQEEIMKSLKQIINQDPLYQVLSKRQLTLKQDSKVVNDSLLSLSKRVFELKSFVTRELGNMNNRIDESIDAIKSKRTDLITSKQQFAMTSMNNLAIMLDDALKQMQEQMQQAQQKQGSGSKSCKKPNNKPGKTPSLSQMQKQLGQMMEKMMKDGSKPSKEMSEQLAKMAALQEFIRKSLSKMDNKGKEKGGKGAGDSNEALKKEMEKNIDDLVNKKLNQQTIDRQRQIETRLLESEKAKEEQDEEEERKAEKAKDINATPPKQLEEFLKKKQTEVEMLKTVPPAYNEFYKQQSIDYFNRIIN